MKKIIAVILSCLILSTSLYITNNLPVFKDYSNEYEVYLSDYSDTSKQIKVDLLQFLFTSDIKGQTIAIRKEQFNLQTFLQDMSAKIVHTSSVSSVTSYYCYSNKIKSYKIVNGVKVNLHVAIQKDSVKVGSPIIYGSF